MKLIVILSEHFSHTWKKYLMCFIIGIAITILSIFSSGGFSYLVSYVNGTFSGGFVLLCLCGLSVVSYLGAFDMFSYAFLNKDVKNEGYYNYSIRSKETRRKNRFNYIPYLVVATLFIITSLIISLFL